MNHTDEAIIFKHVQVRIETYFSDAEQFFKSQMLVPQVFKFNFYTADIKITLDMNSLS